MHTSWLATGDCQCICRSLSATCYHLIQDYVSSTVVYWLLLSPDTKKVPSPFWSVEFVCSACVCIELFLFFPFSPKEYLLG